MFYKILLSLLLTFFPNIVLANSMSATFYSNKLAGRRMANGTIYKPSSNTIATNNYKLGTRLKVCYKGRCVIGVVRDRCSCSIDLSSGLFSQLASLKKGRIPVKVYRY